DTDPDAPGRFTITRRKRLPLTLPALPLIRPPTQDFALRSTLPESVMDLSHQGLRCYGPVSRNDPGCIERPAQRAAVDCVERHIPQFDPESESLNAADSI